MLENIAQKSHEADVTIWVGKSGINSVVGELEKQLETRDVVKVKFLHSSCSDSMENLAKELGEKADANLYETRGHTAVYYKD